MKIITALTLLVFNPLEAFVLISVAFKNYGFLNCKNIIHVYILSLVNFLIQDSPKYIENNMINFLFSYFYSFILLGIVLYLYINFIMKIKVKVGDCVLINILNTLTVMMFSIVISNIFKGIIFSSDFENCLLNIAIQLIIRLAMFLFTIIIYRRKKC